MLFVFKLLQVYMHTENKATGITAEQAKYEKESYQNHSENSVYDFFLLFFVGVVVPALARKSGLCSFAAGLKGSLYLASPTRVN